MKMPKMKALDWIATILVLVGALNWGLVGALGFNLVQYLMTMAGLTAYTSWVYALVGLSAIWSGYKLFFKK